MKYKIISGDVMKIERDERQFKQKLINKTGTKVYFSFPNISIELKNVKKAPNAVTGRDS